MLEKHRPALLLVVAACIGAAGSPGHAVEGDNLALPDPIMTPGAEDPLATTEIVCNRSTKERRLVTSQTKAEVLAAYNIPRAQSASYEIDHLVPLAIGGSNVAANLWPQPWVEADQKDVLEVELQREVCSGLVSQAEAQREVAEDWIASYRRRVGGRLVAALPPTMVTRPPTITERLKDKVRKLARSFVLGIE